MASASNVTKQIIAYLSENIRNGSWPVGSKLPSEHQLCQMLGVSRISVRSAMQHLAAIGAVQTIRGKGSFLLSADLSALGEDLSIRSTERLREIFEFARLAWPPMCRQLAGQIDPPGLHRLEVIALRLRQLPEGEWRQLVHLVMEFHYALSLAFRNSLITEMTESVLRELATYHCVDNWNLVYHGLVYYFDLLLTALRMGDGERAAVAMGDYLRHSVEFCYPLTEPQQAGQPEGGEALPEA